MATMEIDTGRVEHAIREALRDDPDASARTLEGIAMGEVNRQIAAYLGGWHILDARVLEPHLFRPMFGTRKGEVRDDTE